MVRMRIAHDLHDGLGVKITSARMALSSRYETSTLPEVRSCVTDCLNALNEIHSELRLILAQLAPADLIHGRLGYAIHSLIRKIGEHNHLAFDCDLDENINSIKPEVSIQIYRIVQELVHNTIKHAQAKFVTLSIWLRASSLEFEYTDDGNGFDPDAVSSKGSQSIGISSIRERSKRINGICRFDSRPMEGMSFYLSVPVSSL
jgi:signal transduction histidine kinase